MRYEIVCYLAGPLSLWSEKPHPREIIARRSSRWRWLALALAKSVLAAADSGRCGFVVTRNGEVIHHERARDEQCNPVADEAMHVPETFSTNDSELGARVVQNLRKALAQ